MMLGKTNILFVSKSDASEAQLVQETYLTHSAGDIRKIEYINNMFFAYTSNKDVLYGADIGSLSFIKRNDTTLEATHFIYHEGKYYFCDAYAQKQEKAVVYATRDFASYEELVIEEDVGGDSKYSVSFSVSGIFKDSKERIVIMIRKQVSTGVTNELDLYIYESFANMSVKETVICNNKDIADVGAEYSILLKDRIIINANRFICDLAGNVDNNQYVIVSYAKDYFFYTMTERLNKMTGIYKSFDGKNWTRCIDFDIDDAYRVAYHFKPGDSDSYPDIFSMSGMICLIYCDSQEKFYINLTDDIRKIGNPTNETFEIDMPGYVCSVTEDEDGNAYMGCTGGVIIKCCIDRDGTTQLPDVQLVKTLAARQALAQAKQYTDEKVAELKVYFDSSMGQQ